MLTLTMKCSTLEFTLNNSLVVQTPCPYHVFVINGEYS